MNDQLFNPADYGATIKAAKHRTPPEVAVVLVRPPWVVLRHVRHAPVAHLNKLGDIDTPRANGVSVAECGALGMPMSEFDRTSMPACTECAKAARKRGLL